MVGPGSKGSPAHLSSPLLSSSVTWGLLSLSGSLFPSMKNQKLDKDKDSSPSGGILSPCANQIQPKELVTRMCSYGENFADSMRGPWASGGRTSVRSPMCVFLSDSSIPEGAQDEMGRVQGYAKRPRACPQPGSYCFLPFPKNHSPTLPVWLLQGSFLRWLYADRSTNTLSAPKEGRIFSLEDEFLHSVKVC